MAARIIRPSRIPPSIPTEVELFVEGELDRYELIREGVVPDEDELLARLDAHSLEMSDEAAGGNQASDLTSAAGMVLKGIGRHVSLMQEAATEADPDRIRRAQAGLVYAALIRSGVAVTQWSDLLVRTPFEPLVWPSDTHVVCTTVALSLESHLGSSDRTLRLADKIHAHAAGLIS